VRGAVNGQVEPEVECSSYGGLHWEIDEQVEHDENQEKVKIADPVPNSEEAGTWYYVVHCTTCNAVIPFKHAPEGEPIVRFPAMRVRCFECGTAHSYAADLVSHRKAVAPRRIFKRDQLADPPDNAQEARQENHSVGDSGGREIVECRIESETTSLPRDNCVIATVTGKRATIFFLSSCFFAAGWVLQLTLNISYPFHLTVLDQVRPYGPAVLLDSAYFGAILCGLALLILGTGSFLVDTYAFKCNVLGKDGLALVTSNAFMRSVTTWISSSETASATSLARQARRAFSPMVSGAATFRSRIKRSAKLRLRHYR
jgi:hypothetical protein